MNQKVCSKCGEARDEQSFLKWRNGRHSAVTVCLPCRREQSRVGTARYYAEVDENGHRVHPRPKRPAGSQAAYCRERKMRDPFGASSREIARRLGAPIEEVRSLLGVDACEICGSRVRLCVDHDHGTGRLRGRLCQGCNIGIGFLGDDPRRLVDAASYLLRHVDGDEMIGYDNETW